MVELFDGAGSVAGEGVGSGVVVLVEGVGEGVGDGVGVGEGVGDGVGERVDTGVVELVEGAGSVAGEGVGSGVVVLVEGVGEAVGDGVGVGEGVGERVGTGVVELVEGVVELVEGEGTGASCPLPVSVDGLGGYMPPYATVDSIMERLGMRSAVSSMSSTVSRDSMSLRVSAEVSLVPTRRRSSIRWAKDRSSSEPLALSFLLSGRLRCLRKHGRRLVEGRIGGKRRWRGG